MEKPNYILKANEAVFVPKNKNQALEITVISSLIIVGVILIVLWIFRISSLFIWITGILLWLLFGLILGSSRITRKKITVPSPFEIRFYDDCLIIYREKVYGNRKRSRKTYEKLYYKDIHQCEYKMITGMMVFTGEVEGIWFDYNKNGSVPETPTSQFTADASYFYTTEDRVTDFVSEIENHSPIKVIMLDE